MAIRLDLERISCAYTKIPDRSLLRLSLALRAGNLVALFLLVSYLLASCTSTPGSGQRTQLTVFAAASLAESMQALADNFEEQNPGVDVALNLASSYQLVQQLTAGAQADVFASANPQQMQVAVENGLVREGEHQVFANNRLVVVTPPGNPGEVKDLADLAKPGLRLVLAAQEVPAGRYAQEILQRASGDRSLGSDYAERVLRNVVSYEQSVRFVLTKVVLGEAGAGIVYATDADSPDGQSLGVIEIPEPLNPRAAYVIAPVAGAHQTDLARAFIDFVLSPEGQGILRAYGFQAVR